MAVVAHSATPDKTDKVELEFWDIDGARGEKSRMKVQNVSADSTAITIERTNASLALFLLRLIARLQSIATVPCIDVLTYAANISIETAD